MLYEVSVYKRIRKIIAPLTRKIMVGEREERTSANNMQEIYMKQAARPVSNVLLGLTLIPKW